MLSIEHFPLVGHFECLDSQQNKSERFAALMSLPAWTGRSLQDSRQIGNAIRSHSRSGNTCSHGPQIRKEVVITRHPFLFLQQEEQGGGQPGRLRHNGPNCASAVSGPAAAALGFDIPREPTHTIRWVTKVPVARVAWAHGAMWMMI